MLYFSKLRITIISLVSLLFIIIASSNLFKFDNTFLNKKINLGLDLQGGSYLLLEVGSEVLIKEELENISDSIRQISRKEKIKIKDVDITSENIIFRFNDAESIDIIREKFLSNYRDVSASIDNNIMKINITDTFKKRIHESAIKQSLEIVRRRIDESGTKEPLIQRSGKNRILLQLPGVKEPERIKDLLGKTAKLTFHLVDDEDTKSLNANRAPFGKIILSDSINPDIKYLVE